MVSSALGLTGRIAGLSWTEWLTGAAPSLHCRWIFSHRVKPFGAHKSGDYIYAIFSIFAARTNLGGLEEMISSPACTVAIP
jgi:hypothetical protein